MTVTVTLLFANAAAAAAALSRIDAQDVATPLPKIEAAEAQAPKSTKPAKPAAETKQAVATPPSAVTAPADAPFAYETLRSLVLPAIPKHGVEPFVAIAGEFGFPTLKDLGAKGTSEQWRQAHSKVAAFLSAQEAA